MQTPQTEEYREIPLTDWQIAKVDLCCFAEISAHAWQAQWNANSRSFYAVRCGLVYGVRRTIYMHRQILGLEYGDKRTGDHVFHDTLDNRLFVNELPNLRIANRVQQQQNQRKRRSNTSGYKGVSLFKAGIYVAMIRANGRQINLGYRKTAEAAWRELYVPAALEYHGEFACIE